MPADQCKIIKKLRAFITQDSDLNSQLANKITKRHAWCFGFSICHALMATQNNLDWWDNALNAILSWDEKQTSLDQVVYLPESIEGGPLPLRIVFQKIIRYVTHFNGFDGSGSFEDQQQVLEPLNEIFRVKQDDGSFKTIQRHNRIAGYLSNHLLVNLFDEMRIKLFSSQKNAHPICIIRSPKHACALRYVNNQWRFFDPNYTEGKERAFNNTKEAVTEVTRILGNALAIDFASLDAKDNLSLTTYESHKSKKPAELLQNLGLQMIAIHCPNSTSQLFTQIENESESKSVLADALCTQNHKNWNGLHTLAIYSSDGLKKIIELAQSSYDLQDGLAWALCAQDCEHWSGLHMIAQYAPGNLIKLFALAKTSIPLKKGLTRALCEQEDNEHYMGLHSVIEYAPESLQYLFELGEHNNELQQSIATALCTKNNTGKTGWEMLEQHAPDLLQKGLEIILQAFKLPELFELAENDSQSATTLKTLCTKHNVDFEKLYSVMTTLREKHIRPRENLYALQNLYDQINKLNNVGILTQATYDAVAIQKEEHVNLVTNSLILLNAQKALNTKTISTILDHPNDAERITNLLLKRCQFFRGESCDDSACVFRALTF
jgi:hypothetical protein